MMRKTRIFVDQVLQEGNELVLPEDAAHHISRVLRLRPGDAFILFNGRGGEYDAELLSVDKNRVEVHINNYRHTNNESSLYITLAQGISRGHKMDFTLQKAVELGVSRVVPVMTAHGNVRIEKNRLQKKIEHWNKIIIGACEQCGRTRLPELVTPLSIDEWVATDDVTTRIILHPECEKRFSELSRPPDKITILAGPEGGFSNEEIKKACESGYQAINIGPRILRTETAALVAISACHTLWGDLA